ncbi:MAG: ATP-dependent sacrificial sulfur transferase LarE [Oscillospiraceae bacterium]
MKLQDFFVENQRAALAFSGGVDSAYLLYAGLRCQADVRPYFVKTVFQPEFELRDAQRLCRELEIPLTVLELDILALPGIGDNPANRCYGCKTAMLGLLRQRAAADGYSLLLDGTNASDRGENRPGMRALTELQIQSPLRDCGLTKAEIRRLSREAGLFTGDKPAYACLATRIPTEEPITAELLARIEAAEDCLSALGFSDFRVRVFHGAARLQFPGEQLDRAWAQRQRLVSALKPLFPIVLMDTEER